MARDRSIEELLESILEDRKAESGTSATGKPSQQSRTLVADHQVFRTILEMKELMRHTVDILELEATRLRHELDLLELRGDSTVYH